MKFCETESEFIHWAIDLYRDEQRDKSEEPGSPMDVCKLMEYKCPKTVWADGECDYRRGFTHGIAYAVELIDMLRRKGYSRSSEISTIIDEFNITRLYAWRYHARDAIARGEWREGHPKLEIERWKAIRDKVFQRDGFRCQYCGSKTDLECDHINPVYNGGLPLMENLQTLCARCNWKKGNE